MTDPTTTAGAATGPARFATTRYTLESTSSGERFEYATSARGPDGRFRFVWTLAAGKTGPIEHVHETETERFEVVSGTIRIWLRGAPRDHVAGDVVVVAPGVPHRFLHPGREPVVVNVTLDGTRMEDSMVPLAVATHGRALRAGDLLRMVAGLGRPYPSKSTSPVTGALVDLAVALLRLVGVRPLPPVVGWDAAGAP